MPPGPHPWRRLPGTAKKPAARPLVSLQKALAKPTAIPRLEPIRAGVDHAPSPQMAARLVSAIALVDTLSAEGLTAATVEQLGDAERLVARCASSSLVPSVNALLGVAQAVALRIAADSVRLDAASGGWTTAVWLTEEPTRRRHWDLSGWEPLRHAVCRSDDAAYQEAIERVAWPTLPTEVRPYVAFAFPDEPWAEELLAAALSQPAPDLSAIGHLLTACTDGELLAQAARATGGPHLVAQAAADLVAVLPASACVPVFAHAIGALLVKPRYGPLLKTPPRLVAQALTTLGDAASAEVMASYLGHKVLGAQAVAFFEAHPQHAQRLGDSASELRERLTPAAPVDLASPDDVPELLRTRAWRATTKPKETVVVGLAWPHPLDEQFLAPAGIETSVVPSRPMKPVELAEWRAEAGYRYVDRQPVYARGRQVTFLEVPSAEGLVVWNGGKGLVQDAWRWAQRHGPAALPGFLSGSWARWLHEEHGRTHLAILQAMGTPAVVPAFVELFHRKRWRTTAERWLVSHMELAAIGLLPMALGPRGTQRRRAQQVVVHLGRTGHASVLLAVADTYGVEATSVVEELLARPHTLPGKPPKRPDFLRPATLPPVRVRGGDALPPDAVDALLELLSLDPSGEAYPLLDLASALDAESMERFLSALLELWVDHDAPGRHDWMLRAVLALPTPQNQRRVAELARRWCQNAKAKASRAMTVLAEIGDERALLTLTHIAHSSRVQALKGEARGLLAHIAADRGWSAEQLDDRTVPTLGLDEAGGMTLDLGHRQVRAQVGSELVVQLVDDQGGRLRAMPRAGDDPAAHRAAKKQLAALRRDVAAIGTRQRQRLEAAMVSGRTWPLAAARRWLFEAPLLGGMVRALVWLHDGVAFRVCEDGSFADVADESIELHGGQVRLGHPLSLDVAAWGERLADYELIQPFAQLARPVHRSGDPAMAVLGGVGPVPGRKAMGVLAARGWERMGGQWITGWRRGEAELRAEPGIEVAHLSDGEQPVGVQVVGDVGGLSEVACSELVADLQALAELES